MSEEVLAWNKKPEPDGILYSAKQLAREETVLDLFNRCEHSEGYITAEGWAFLFEVYGAQKLLEIHLKSAWVDREAPMAGLVYQSLIAGYNPIQNEKGDYDPDTEYFLTLDGLKSKVDWEELKKY